MDGYCWGGWNYRSDWDEKDANLTSFKCGDTCTSTQSAVHVSILESARNRRNGGRTVKSARGNCRLTFLCKLVQLSQNSESEAISATEAKFRSTAGSDLTDVLVFPRVSGVYVDQLEDQRSPGYDTGPAGQKVPAHQALQH